MIMESFIHVKKSSLRGELTIPPSKSHTIRGIIFGLLADGVSEIKNPLDAEDTRSCVRCCRLLGADIRTGKTWRIKGVGGEIAVPEEPLYVGNSGTTLGNLVAVSALGKASVTLDGDSSIRSRPFLPLLNALSLLGVETSSRNNLGKCPITVRGPLRGGTATVDGITSIYITPFLVACPLADENTILNVIPPVNERSYIRMTMNWLDFLHCSYTTSNFTNIRILGGQSYTSFKRTIPGDASSAAFPICAAAATSSEVTIRGLDLEDPQGDKAIIEYLRKMGAEIEPTEECLILHPSTLTGTTLDLTDTPDLFPILCVMGCAAEGETVLQNIEVTRMKETDRVKAMTAELKKMGGTLIEAEPELHIKKSTLHGAKVRGYNDHRIVMALAVAGMIAAGTTVIDSAESISVTYPTFVESMQQLGANIKKNQSPEDEKNDTSPGKNQKRRTRKMQRGD
jgi:3-phosphoshikimate 1-carboxyvinyltransferase